MKKTLLTFKSLVIAIVVTAFPLNTIFGQVATLQNWTNLYHGTVSTLQNINYPISTGTNTNRVLVVAIASSRSPANSITVTLTYKGQALTLANGDMGLTSVKQHTALYYLDEAGLDAAGDPILSFTVSGGTRGITDIWAAVFDYVNQTTPLTNTQTYSSVTGQVSNFSFGTGLAINAYNQAIEIVSSHNSLNNQPSNITYASEWTMMMDQTGTYIYAMSSFSIRNGVANRNIPTSPLLDISSTTFNPNALASMTALSLNYETPPPPTIQTSNVTFSDVTTSSFTINWTSGNGTNRLVLVKAGSAVDSDPANGTSYTASDLFGSGSQIGTGNYVVYNGTGYNVTIFNLDANTTYHVAVYEFSGPGTQVVYLTPPARGNQLTEPETAVTDDYRSNGSGTWGTAETWQTFDGASWVTAGSPPNSSSGLITIRNGHTITVAEAVTVDQVVVEAGAQLNVGAGVTLTIADGTGAVDCSIDGKLFNEGTVTSTGILALNSISEYEHGRDGGIIPTATWDANSLCLVTGITNTAPTGFGQSFGNFTWNCTSQIVTVAMNSNTSMQGDCRLSSTGTGKLSITDSNNPIFLTVSGNYFQTAGTFDLNSGAASSAVGTLNVAGNFSFTGGAITETSSSGRGSVVFNGAGSMQTYTSGGTLANTIDFTVATGAYLQMGTGSNPSYISNSDGTFTLSSGSTLGITDRYGITTFGPPIGGNIMVTGTRSFNSGANYIYNGSVPQNTGNGLPLTVNSLIFNNSGGSVLFNAARTINNFSINAGSKAKLGIFTHLTSSLSLGGVGQPSGTYGSTSSPATNKNDTYFDVATTGIVNNQPPSGTWIGATSTDWNTASNWIGGVPTSATNAIIPSGPAYQPIVLNTPLAECNNLTIESGASLTINAGQALTAQGNINNSGTLNLNSSETAIASLILDSYTDNGTENIQLFLTGGGDESNFPWHYISSPATTLSTDIFTTGDSRSYDLAAYYENHPSPDKDLRWVAWDGWDYSIEGYPASPVTFNNLEPGKGYNIYFYESSVIKTFGGNLNTSDETESLSFTSGSDNSTQGWNCLGNPFSSGLDWDAITKPTGVDNAIYFTVNNTRASYVDGVSNNGATGLIPPMQGFFIKANQSGLSLTLPASARVHNFHSRYKGEAETIPLIRLKIENNKRSDETIIRLDEKAKNAFDSNLDAYKFGKDGTDVSLWTTIGNVVYSINSIPFPETETEVPVGVKISESGTYKLTTSQLQGIDNYNVYLTDKSTGITLNLKNTPALSFNASEGMYSDRFVIKITNISTAGENPTASETNFNIYSSNELINIQTLSDDWDGKAGSVGLIDISGKEIKRIDNTEFWKNSLIQIPAAGLRGIYFVKMQSGLMRYVGKVMIR